MRPALDSLQVHDTAAAVLRHRSIGDVDHVGARPVDGLDVGYDRARRGRQSYKQGTSKQAKRWAQWQAWRDVIAHDGLTLAAASSGVVNHLCQTGEDLDKSCVGEFEAGKH